MNNTANFPQRFTLQKTCVVIPTYNNATTLAAVIADVYQYCSDIIVVNDGSTDNTTAVAASFSYVQFISYEKNAGKGWALRTAFKYAIEKGYDFAITIDSDGQHFAKDLPVFLEKLETEKNAIIIGARNMEQESVPGKSSFGNKFSNFWFKLETGIDCPDTQSGFRAYPIYLLKNTRYFTNKYEFEIEVIVRAAWKGIDVQPVPITVFYAPKEERISHFRPFKDFSRISVLNTVMVLITFLYIKPRDFLRTIFQKKKLKELLKNQLFNSEQSAALKSTSIAFGIFMGIIPIWGFQLAIAIFLAIVLKLNKALVIIAANISVPPMIPLIIFGSYKMGAIWMNKNVVNLEYTNTLSLKAIQQNLTQYIYGSITLAIVAALLFGVTSFILLKLFKKVPGQNKLTV